MLYGVYQKIRQNTLEFEAAEDEQRVKLQEIANASVAQAMEAQNKRIESISAEMERMKQDFQDQLEAKDAQIAAKDAFIARLQGEKNAEIERLQGEINDLQVAVRKRDKRIAELEDKLAGMVEELRKLKDKTDELKK